MDEISQDPKLDVRLPRGRSWTLRWRGPIAAAAITVLAGRGSLSAAAPRRAGPARRRPLALLPSTVRARIPLPEVPASPAA